MNQMRQLKRPYFLLEATYEVAEAKYVGMGCGMPPVCFVCRKGTDGPRMGAAECLCGECYKAIESNRNEVRRAMVPN